MKIETGIIKTPYGCQDWFKIDNQTFYLSEHIEETGYETLQIALFFEKMLNLAFKKLNIHAS